MQTLKIDSNVEVCTARSIDSNIKVCTVFPFSSLAEFVLFAWASTHECDKCARARERDFNVSLPRQPASGQPQTVSEVQPFSILEWPVEIILIFNAVPKLDLH